MVTSAEEYRSARYKEVELPSTLPNGEHPIFVIRKPPTRVLIQVLDLFDVAVTSETKPEEIEQALSERVPKIDIKEKLPGLLELLITSCVVKPRITLDLSEEDAIYFDDLDYEDQFALLDAIWDFAGLSKEAEAERNLSLEAQ